MPANESCARGCLILLINEWGPEFIKGSNANGRRLAGLSDAAGLRCPIIHLSKWIIEPNALHSTNLWQNGALRVVRNATQPCNVTAQ